MKSNESIQLKRDVIVSQVPSGKEVAILQGEMADVLQSLGGTYTVSISGREGLYRISQADADALGFERTTASPVSKGRVTEDAVWDQLKSCYDPEIPVNIVDLGLIYSMELISGEKGMRVKVRMTLTAPGCGMGKVIAEDAKSKIESLPGIEEACVEVVWDPQWNPSMISPEGKKKLGIP